MIWRTRMEVVVERSPGAPIHATPCGAWLERDLAGRRAVFFHGGYGKVNAAGSTQYAIDRWHPRLVLNLGTCGAFGHGLHVGDIVLAKTTTIYDIYEAMGDADEAIAEFRTQLDVSRWPARLASRVRVEPLIFGRSRSDSRRDRQAAREVRRRRRRLGIGRDRLRRREEPHARGDPARRHRRARRDASPSDVRQREPAVAAREHEALIARAHRLPCVALPSCSERPPARHGCALQVDCRRALARPYVRRRSRTRAVDDAVEVGRAAARACREARARPTRCSRLSPHSHEPHDTRRRAARRATPTCVHLRP